MATDYPPDELRRLAAQWDAAAEEAFAHSRDFEDADAGPELNEAAQHLHAAYDELQEAASLTRTAAEEQA